MLKKNWAFILLMVVLFTALLLRVKSFFYPETIPDNIGVEDVITTTDENMPTRTASITPEVSPPIATTTTGTPGVVDSTSTPPVQKPAVSPYISETVVFPSTSTRVMLSNTPELRYKGLTGMPSLGEYGGMLFDFGSLGYYGMVMRGMKFPLDFVWISGLTVVDTDENAPLEPGKTESEFTVYMNKTLCDKVIEVPAGFVAKNGIKPGDEVRIEK